MNLEKWKNNLNWTTIPSFGPIHKLEKGEFNKFYYLPESLKEVTNTLCYSLEEGFGNENKLIIGEPGSGKTTFFYYLVKELASKNSIFNDYFFKIIHIGRFHAMKDVEEVIEKRTLKLLKEYFDICGLNSEYSTLVKDERINKEKINIIEDFIITERKKFAKRLVVILDDIDETKELEVERSLRYFHSLLECHQIPKWLVVRNTSLNNYKRDFLNFIETKFGENINFPRVDLFGILEKRIKAKSPKGINPFISELCLRVVKVFDYDLRKSCVNIIAFLKKVEPLSHEKFSPEFIGNYFLKNFTKVMTSIDVFPNIFYKTEVPYVPLEKDVLLIISLFNRFPVEYLSILESHYKDAYSKFDKSYSHLITIDMGHVNNCLRYLEDKRLIESGEIDNTIFRLTSRGNVFAQFVTEKLYIEHCKEECDNAGQIKPYGFWYLSRRFLKSKRLLY